MFLKDLRQATVVEDGCWWRLVAIVECWRRLMLSTGLWLLVDGGGRSFWCLDGEIVVLNTIPLDAGQEK